MTENLAVTPTTPSRTRRIVFTCVGTVLAVLFATNLVNLFAPWTDVNLNHVADPSSHRWHHAFEGANDLFAVVLIVALLLKPLARQLLAQHITVAACLSAILVLPFVGPMYLLILASLLLVPATYPRPAKLLQFRSDAGVSRPVLLVAAGAAALLLARAAQEMHWQLTGYLGEHATSNAWIGDAAHLVILAAAGLLAATRLPGYRVLAVTLATVYAYLGIVAIAQPDQPGSWGIPGGITALVAAALFVAATYAHPPVTKGRPGHRRARE